MTPLLLALAMLAAPPAGATETDARMTAGQLFDDCARYVVRGDGSAAPGDDGGVICAAVVASQLVVNAAEEVLADTEEGRSHPRSFCLPESVTRTEDGTGSPLAEVFIIYVDRHPASRAHDSDEVFKRALAEAWPCPPR